MRADGKSNPFSPKQNRQDGTFLVKPDGKKPRIYLIRRLVTHSLNFARGQNREIEVREKGREEGVVSDKFSLISESGREVLRKMRCDLSLD